MASQKHKEPVVTHSCANCRHYGVSQKIACCKRYPPVPVYDYSSGNVMAHYPVVEQDDKCSEWAPVLAS
ncbi:hypothetical protein BGLT_05196 [Caballeronia glathei]|nr:hypothetical protein BGLT_05196 [Caballeronia glathei]